MANQVLEQKPQFEGEIDLRELLAVLWEGKISILSGFLLSLVLSISYAFSLPDKYTAEALLAPRAEGATSGLSSLSSQYGGLASLAGLNLGGAGGNSKSAIAMELLKSRDFFSRYLYEYVLVDLMAADGWEASEKKLFYDSSRYSVADGKWVLDGMVGDRFKPSVQEAHAEFTKDFLRVSKDSQTGFVSVRITHYSPNVARDWVDLIVQGVNQAVRARDVQEAENSIAFLNEQRLKTNLVSLTEVFSELIEEQTKTVMLANASDEYVYQVIEPPVAPEVKSEPGRRGIVVAGVLLGAGLALLLVLIKYFLSSSNGKTKAA